MIFNSINALRDFLAARGLFGYFRVFTFVEFRAIFAVLFSFAFVILLGPRVIRWLIKQKIGDQPEFYNKTLNELTKGKTNTPTMGGILISAAILCTILLLADLTCFYVHMAIVCQLWCTFLGFSDDWLKLTGKRLGHNRREGLLAWEKLLFQIALGVLLGLFIHYFGEPSLKQDSGVNMDADTLRQMSHSLNLPFFKTWAFDNNLREWVPSHINELPAVAFVLLTMFVIVGSTNAVNLTDGMDGLATGITAICAFALGVLAFIAGFDDGGQALAQKLLVPYIPASDELAIVAGAMVGSCLGFLWYNCNPAQVFMGDTGSLTLGGMLGYIAIVIRQEFLLLIVGGIFALEALSVILQVGYFKFTGGKRIFRMAPIHHHFHLGGWTEQQVVVRFWIVTAVLAAMALATVKIR